MASPLSSRHDTSQDCGQNIPAKKEPVTTSVPMHDSPMLGKASLPLQVLQEFQNSGLSFNDSGKIYLPVTSRTHPRNRPLKCRILQSLLTCAIEHVTMLIRNSGSEVVKDVVPLLRMTELAIHATLARSYIVGQAIGGLVFPPSAETFGKPVTSCSTRWIGNVDPGQPRPLHTDS
jgi:hypothetical protein